MFEVRRGVVGVLLATAIMAAGCGGDDEEGGGEQAGGGEQEQAAGATDVASLLKGKELTFVSFGGAYQEAQDKAMLQTAEQQYGTKFKQDGPTDYAKIKTQVASQQVSWDVVDSDPFFAIHVLLRPGVQQGQVRHRAAGLEGLLRHAAVPGQARAVELLPGRRLRGRAAGRRRPGRPAVPDRLRPGVQEARHHQEGPGLLGVRRAVPADGRVG